MNLAYFFKFKYFYEQISIVKNDSKQYLIIKGANLDKFLEKFKTSGLHQPFLLLANYQGNRNEEKWGVYFWFRRGKRGHAAAPSAWELEKTAPDRDVNNGMHNMALL